MSKCRSTCKASLRQLPSAGQEVLPSDCCPTIKKMMKRDDKHDKEGKNMIKISTCPSAALGCWLSATRERPEGGEDRLQFVQTRCLNRVHPGKGLVVWMGERMDFLVNAGTALRIAKYPRPAQNLPSPLVQARHCPHCCYCSSPPRPPAERRCCCSPSVFPWQTAPAP